MNPLHGPLAHYAERLHRAAGDAHHVASPLGAWLLLALTGPAATDDARTRLEESLGTDVDDAAEAAHALLAAPHPLVAAATALWERTPFAELAGWRATLPERTQTGPLPDQATLDAWAREHTDGLIDRFPLGVTPDTLLILASALATKVSWAEPFQVAPAEQLGPGSPWAGRIDRVLRTPWHGHQCWIAETARAGDVAVHAAPARPAADGQAGILVVSVAAAPDVPAADVLAAAEKIAAGAANGREPGRRSLYDLPLGDTPLWTLREETVRTFAPAGREEQVSAVLPCWSAESRHDLTPAGFGFDAAARALGRLLGLAEPPYEAVQSAVARYGRYGFEAAAVTAFAMATGLPPEGVARVAELRFGHPYAVVAVATDRADGPWHGLPVYSAWVAEPAELPEAELADPPRQW
ncbi:Serpin (serine protease inhibitor) [Micromonospora viridifaciens]|uniref:Serpin (Serine protease inhibitor) n=1 Tax=Micromonospora viridifaciens TaxID=1881 RepID=A0A1C4X9A8_MICVI|nr:serpin family protein [Micromonospora viridifaciens]SCF04791.1 Serpin (serine protease inhibitor) [Micromonospora viridifaciens]